MRATWAALLLFLSIGLADAHESTTVHHSKCLAKHADEAVDGHLGVTHLQRRGNDKKGKSGTLSTLMTGARITGKSSAQTAVWTGVSSLPPGRTSRAVVAHAASGGHAVAAGVHGALGRAEDMAVNGMTSYNMHKVGRRHRNDKTWSDGMHKSVVKTLKKGYWQ